MQPLLAVWNPSRILPLTHSGGVGGRAAVKGEGLSVSSPRALGEEEMADISDFRYLQWCPVSFLWEGGGGEVRRGPTS